MDSKMREVLIKDIYYKFKNNIELSDFELRLVYGVDMGPYIDDDLSKLLDEVLASREYKRRDLAQILNVPENKISLYDEIPGKDVMYHYGDLELFTYNIDDFELPGYVFGSCIIDEVSKIDKYSDGPNGEKIPEQVYFPYYIKKDFIMGSLEEAHRVLLPATVGRNVDFRSLKEINESRICDVYGNVDLSSMENEEVVEYFDCDGEIIYDHRNKVKRKKI